MGTVRISICAGCEALRLGLAASLHEKYGIEVVRQAGSIGGLATKGVADADVLVIDVDTLTGSASNLAERMGRPLSHLKVLFIGTPHDAQTVRAEDIPGYMSMQTVGFVLKNTPVERLAWAIQLVASGAFVTEAGLIKRMLNRLVTWASSGPSDGDQLSGREKEVLALVARGKSSRDIAHELFVSEGTVRAHASHLLTKLGLERRTELVRYAITNGIASEMDD